MSAWVQLVDEFKRTERPPNSKTTEEFADDLGLKPTRARIILNELVRKGKLKKITYRGSGRGSGCMVCYVVADRG